MQELQNVTKAKISHALKRLCLPDAGLPRTSDLRKTVFVECNKANSAQGVPVAGTLPFFTCSRVNSNYRLASPAFNLKPLPLHFFSMLAVRATKAGTPVFSLLWKCLLFLTVSKTALLRGETCLIVSSCAFSLSSTAFWPPLFLMRSCLPDLTGVPLCVMNCLPLADFKIFFIFQHFACGSVDLTEIVEFLSCANISVYQVWKLF